MLVIVACHRGNASDICYCKIQVTFVTAKTQVTFVTIKMQVTFVTAEMQVT